MLTTNKMSFRALLNSTIALSIALGAANVQAAGQRTAGSAPKQEKLLNGLRVHMWSDQASDRVSARLRIHSGAAFDPAGREGLMQMLAEAFFPTDLGRAFFPEDLGGNLEIICNYDHIQINVSSRPEGFLTMLETLAAAVTNPTFDKETTEASRARVLERLRRSVEEQDYLADTAAAKRLLGSFPYGRPIFGTVETLAKVDFADLKIAYGRLAGADNATLSLSGRFDPALGSRATKRFFGSWLKSDGRVPPTFRQPDPPPTETLVIAAPQKGPDEVRYAVRGVARNDKDFAAAEVLAEIMETRLRSKAPAEIRDRLFVVNNAYLLPGMFVIGKTETIAGSIGSGPSMGENGGSNLVAMALAEKVSDAEFAEAKRSVLLVRNAIEPAALWLDADTYRLASVRAEHESFANLTLADVQRVADRLRTSPVVTVIVSSTKQAEH